MYVFFFFFFCETQSFNEEHQNNSGSRGERRKKENPLGDTWIPGVTGREVFERIVTVVN
jgi:hypothetical protein